MKNITLIGVVLMGVASSATAQETTSSTTAASEPATATSTVSAPQEAAQTPEEPPPAELTPPAQPEEVKAEPEDSGMEEVMITGSRIRRRRLDAPGPVVELTEQDMKQTGLTSVGDILQRLPSSGGALNAKFNSSGNFGFPPDGDGIGAGATQADLRYLGSKRVLVLVDGQRWVNGSSASGVSSATDLNTIPMAIIERVEVLQNGASAIYGSDAIAGVINIITKKNYTGVGANAYLGGYGNGDGLTQQYDLNLGTKSDRMSMFLSLSFTRQDPVWSGDRDISAYPIPNLGRCTNQCSSGTPQGRFVFTDPNTMMDRDLALNNGVGGVPMYDAVNGVGGDFHAFDTADRFNFQPFNYILTPSQRFGAFTQADYKLTDNVKLQARVLYNNRTSRNQAAPEPLFIGPEAGNGNRLDTISIDATNPYNPFGFTLDAATNPYFIGRRPLEAGPRDFRQNVNTWFLSGGLNGFFDAAERNIFWDVTTSYSRNRADQIKTGGFNSARLQKALGPLADCEADPECVPFNIFGGQGADGQGSITPEMLNYVSFIEKNVSEQEFFDLTGNISSEIVELPGGFLGVALGFEHRLLSGFYRPDAIIVAGDSSDVPSSPTEGRYNVTEGYGELKIPVLAKMPAVDLLDLSGAVRVSNYSTFGTQSTFSAGMRYRPIADLQIRGSWAQGFRAPGIGELFGSESRFDQTLVDPCSDFNRAEVSAETRANCINLGVPADGSYEQLNSQISVATGGNRELEPEKSTGYSASITYSPSQLENNDFVENLELEVSYFRLDLDDAIRALDAQVQLDRCIRELDARLCQGIARTAAGSINRFENRLTNIGGIKTDGLDFILTYVSPPTKAGQFRVTSLTNLLLNYNLSVPNEGGFEEIELAGTEIGDPVQAYPKVKSTLVLGWGINEFVVSTIGRFIAAVEEECRGLTDFPGLCSAPNADDDDLSKNRLSPRFYLDAQVSWFPAAADQKLAITAGVNNVLNQAPPPCYSCALNGYDASTYDVPGVFAYARVGYKFDE